MTDASERGFLIQAPPDLARGLLVPTEAIGKTRASPRSIIADQGTEFGRVFRRWCRRKGIRPRRGPVGEHGSLAIVERFIRSMKSECTGRI